MYAHPDKKLNFMGSEFAQWAEWNAEQSLDWHLTQWDRHRQIQDYCKYLNDVYRNNPALYEVDFDGSGFSWINCNDWESSVVSFLRKGKNPEDSIVVVCNFTPVIRENYRVGVPKHCHWQEFFNSDAVEYGGSGVGNCGGFWSDQIGWDNQPYSLNLRLPPLAVIMFKPVVDEQ
jgi:1,4-alpha-glucan branching enzyme